MGNMLIMDVNERTMSGQTPYPLFRATYIGQKYFDKAKSHIHDRYQKHLIFFSEHQSLYLVKRGIVDLEKAHEVIGPFGKEQISPHVTFRHKNAEGLTSLLKEFNVLQESNRFQQR